MALNKQCIILRVFDRLEDLSINLDVIRKYWQQNDYHVIVVGNGKTVGYGVPAEIAQKADCVKELSHNPGHMGGDAALLKQGISLVPDSCEFTIILQADTWIFDDAFIQKHIQGLRNSSAVWASTEWVEKYWSLGVDFALAKTDFLKSNLPIVDFTRHAEAWVCNYLLERDCKFVYIDECMPVHRPSIMKRFYNAYGGRFRSFPKASMVTHHLEDLSGGIEEKKLLANYCLGRREFATGDQKIISVENRRLRNLMKLAAILPRSKWFKGKQRHVFDHGAINSEPLQSGSKE